MIEPADFCYDEIVKQLTIHSTRHSLKFRDQCKALKLVSKMSHMDDETKDAVEKMLQKLEEKVKWLIESGRYFDHIDVYCHSIAHLVYDI